MPRLPSPGALSVSLFFNHPGVCAAPCKFPVSLTLFHTHFHTHILQAKSSHPWLGSHSSLEMCLSRMCVCVCGSPIFFLCSLSIVDFFLHSCFCKPLNISQLVCRSCGVKSVDSQAVLWFDYRMITLLALLSYSNNLLYANLFILAFSFLFSSSCNPNLILKCLKLIRVMISMQTNCGSIHKPLGLFP